MSDQPYVAPTDEELEWGYSHASNVTRPMFSIIDDDIHYRKKQARWNPERGWFGGR